MPIYEYKCSNCGKVFDAFQRVGDNGAELSCPDCGTIGPEKLFSAFASSEASLDSYSSLPSSCSTSGFG